MKLANIVSLTNLRLADELLSYVELKPLLDMVIDDINSDANAKYPYFPEVPLTTDEYTAFADCYIRSVVTVGAAYYYYMIDEEGGNASAYSQLYTDNRFIMLRDTLSSIPDQYQASIDQGSVRAKWDEDYGDRGVEVDGSDFII